MATLVTVANRCLWRMLRQLEGRLVAIGKLFPLCLLWPIINAPITPAVSLHPNVRKYPYIPGTCMPCCCLNSMPIRWRRCLPVLHTNGTYFAAAAVDVPTRILQVCYTIAIASGHIHATMPVLALQMENQDESTRRYH